MSSEGGIHIIGSLINVSGEIRDPQVPDPYEMTKEGIPKIDGRAFVLSPGMARGTDLQVGGICVTLKQ